MGGLFNDLVSGLSVGLEGDVQGMVKSVAHGMSDTASKLSNTASSVLVCVSSPLSPISNTASSVLVYMC